MRVANPGSSMLKMSNLGGKRSFAASGKFCAIIAKAAIQAAAARSPRAAPCTKGSNAQNAGFAKSGCKADRWDATGLNLKAVPLFA